MFLARKTFSDETFTSLKVKKEKRKKKNQIGLLVTKFFVARTFSDRGFSDEMSFVAKSPISSLKVLSDEKLDF